MKGAQFVTTEARCPQCGYPLNRDRDGAWCVNIACDFEEPPLPPRQEDDDDDEHRPG